MSKIISNLVLLSFLLLSTLPSQAEEALAEPVISYVSGSGPFPIGTREVEIVISTDVDASCKASKIDNDTPSNWKKYLTSSDNRTHSVRTPLLNDEDTFRYIRCRSLETHVVNTTSFAFPITFSNAQTVATPQNFVVDHANSIDGNFNLSWDAVSGISYYHLLEQNTQGVWQSISLDEGVLNIDLSRVEVGDYQYKIAACNDSALTDCSSFSDEIVVWVGMGNMGDAPVISYVSGSGPHPYGVDNIEMIVSTDINASCRGNHLDTGTFNDWNKLFSTDDNRLHRITVPISGAGDTEKYIRCQANDSQETNLTSFVFPITVNAASSVGMPENFIADPVNNSGNYTLSWDPVPDAVTYLLKESTDGHNWDRLVVDASNVSQDFSKTTDGNYQYYLFACSDELGLDCGKCAAKLTVYVNGGSSNNLTPTIVSSPLLSGAESVLYSYDVDATDPNAGDVLTYSLTNSPAGMTIISDSGIISWVPESAQVGSHSITVSVSDDAGLTDTQTFELVIDDINEAPTIVSAAVTQATQGASYSYPVEATDPDAGDSLTYSLTVFPTGMTIDSLTGIIDWSPTHDQVSDHDVTIVVTDTAGLTATQIFVITVANVNDAPEFTSTPITTGQELVEYSYQLTASDKDNDSLTFGGVTLPDGMTISVDGLLLWTPSVGQEGAHDVSVSVTDPSLENTTQSFIIQVERRANTAPVADAQSLITNEDTALSIILTATDVDNDVLAYEVVTNPTNGALTGTAPNLTYIPNANFFGSDSFTFKANDGVEDSLTVAVSVAITSVNDAPTVSAASFSTNEDTQLAIELTGSDVEGDALTFEIVVQPINGTIAGTGSNITYTPNENFNGNDSFTYLARDTISHSTDARIDLVVNAINDSPIIVSEPVTIAIENSQYSYLVEVIDPDQETMSFSLIQSPFGMSIDAITGQVDWIPVFTDIGAHEITIQVSDPSGSAYQQSFSIVVSAETILDPTINSKPVTIGFLDTQYSYFVDAADPKDLALSYELLEAPQGMGVNSLTGEVTWTPNSEGNFNVELRVINSKGGSALQSYFVDVIDPEPSHMGDDFWLMFGWNHTGGSLIHNLYISSDSETSGLVEVQGLNLSIPFSVVPGEITEVALPAEIEHTRYGVDNKGIHITANEKISVYALNNLTNSTDGFLVYPTRTLGQEYMALEYPKKGLFYALAAEDDTEITFQVPRDLIVNGTQMVAGETSIINLQQGESYLFYQSEDAVDKMFTGSTLTSTKPIAVFSGNECSNVPETVGACDHLFEQVPAIAHWGTSYVSIPLAERFNGDTYRIVAAFDNTDIRINGNIIGTINRGQVIEDIFEDVTEISANHAILVAQFSNGGGFDEAETGNLDHDPFMIYLPAQEKYLKRYTFATPGQQMETNYINVVLPESGLDSFTLDGNTVDANLFSEVGNSGFLGAALPVDIGTHTVQSDEAFGLTIYGYAHTDSYGYAGGMLLATLNDNTINLNVTDTEPSVGDSVCVSASVTQDGKPSVALRIDFSIEGKEDLKDHVFTSNNGEAEFCYSSAFVGTDKVVANANNVSSSININWQWQVNGDGQQPPLIVSTPETDAFVELEYRYQVIAIDPDVGASFSYTLITSPEGMSIGESGLVEWSPLETQQSSYSVAVEVSDETGLIDVQEYVLSVSQLNQSPEIINLPTQFKAYINRANIIDIDAIDPEGKALSYEVVEGPPRLTVSKFTGRVNYYPWTSEIGEYTTKIRIKDGIGGETTAVFTTSVVENLLPEIVSEPSFQAKVGKVYSDAIGVNDPDGDEIKYYRQYGPLGLTVNIDTGQIDFIPTAEQLGSQSVSVLISDGLENIFYNFDIVVSAEDTPFVAYVTANPLVLDLNQSTSIEVSSTGASGPVDYTLTVDGVEFQLDNNGQVNFSNTDHVGNYQMNLVANDGDSIVTAVEHFSVSDPNDISPPQVSLDNIVSGQKITAISDLVATVNDSNLKDWTLYYSEMGSNSTEFTILAEGRSNIEQAVVASFDPTSLTNGQYAIVLDASTLNGLVAQANAVVTIEGNLKVGNFAVSFEDKNIPLAGLPIRVTRTYDSRRKSSNQDFGYGWRIGYQDILIQEAVEPTTSWEQFTATSTFNIDGNIINLSGTCTYPQNEKLVTITLPNGDVESFVARARPISGGEVSISDPNCTLLAGRYVSLLFDARDGTDSELISLDGQSLYLTNVDGGNLALDVIETEAFDVQKYQLTTRAGYIYKLNQYFGIETITDPNGNTITYSDDGIVHSSGKSVDFVRDSQGRITSITDPKGNVVSYDYNATGDLISSTDEVGNVTTYTYNSDHGLLDIIDPLGRTIVKNIYNDDGRLIAQEDNDGIRTNFVHDLAGRQSTVTDRLGRVTNLYYDDEGNVTSQVDALNNVTTFTFDSEGNQLSKTDALNRVTSATYNDNDDQLTQTDALGEVVSFTYNDKGQELTVTDEKGNVFTNDYDAVGNLLSITDPQNNVVSNSINSQGLPLTVTDALNQVTSYTYDNEGNKLTETDPSGAVTSFTYDSNNNVLTQTLSRTLADNSVVDETVSYEYDSKDRIISTTDPLGNVTKTEFDLIGNEVAVVDALNRRTEMEYDAYGRLVKTIYPDNSDSSKTYDAEGNLLTETDRNGNTTSFEYDKLNRLIKTTYADTSETSTEYDAVGQVVAEIDANGNRTTHEYDLAGRRIKTTDALLNEHQFAYDESGNLVSETDALNRTTNYGYDSLDRKVSTTFANLSSVLTGFDALARRTSATDQANVTTNYAYDEVGRLVSVTDVENNVTSYAYDEAGNKLTQTDAEARTTSWTYDALGRVLTRTLPMGQVESFTYDVVGNMLTRTDFNGDVVTYTYDVNNRVTQIDYASDSTTDSFTYDDNGNRLTAINAEGTWTYTYDSMNRLKTETQPNGEVLSYEYDLAGNKTQLKVTYADASTRTEISTYDVLNRLATVTDADGNITSYEYDAVGNRVSVTHSNANVTAYVYDELNRLTQLQDKHSDDTVFQQFDYELHATGRREKITELSGRVSDYTYDSLYRLTDEVITDAVNGDYSASYSFDKVGNRVASTINGVSTVYTYDDNDRLTQEGGEVYSYDDNGNTLSKTIDSDITTYTYDSRQKLIFADILEGGVSKTANYRYNVDGIRTQKVEDGAETNYLVDSNRDYAQVIAETDDADNVTTSYTYGDDLLSMMKSGEIWNYQYDGLGSTRSLTDASGNESDTYTYDAFGSLLSETGSTENDYLYTGEQFDGSLGQYYLRSRYYSANTGRFTQQDVWIGSDPEPGTLNKYAYVLNDPQNLVDPSGYFGISDLLATINVRGILSTTAQPTYRVIFKKGANKLACLAIEEIVTVVATDALFGAGVYLLQDGGKPYVGRSIDFDKRYKQHINNATKKVTGIFALFHVEGKNNQRLVEQFFMDALDTRKNGANVHRSIAENPRSPNSKDLRKKLKTLDFCK
jgi:RHS repeat-associated protein